MFSIIFIPDATGFATRIPITAGKRFSGGRGKVCRRIGRCFRLAFPMPAAPPAGQGRKPHARFIPAWLAGSRLKMHRFQTVSAAVVQPERPAARFNRPATVPQAETCRRTAACISCSHGGRTCCAVPLKKNGTEMCRAALKKPAVQQHKDNRYGSSESAQGSVSPPSGGAMPVRGKLPGLNVWRIR
ncbi:MULTISPECIES: hypothetical protein [unclassified Neisseria]|uniref:hypothetical protein n=1 Tax=unclassified Neisseria TaxID=2623750 RepID=UPI001071F2AB|nr:MULTISPECIES: hypothetical protein [unclassified Neisseria]MBF0804103.1 hypothetical protein [Neisseria sp. 19428wB4_WF04]TFU43182.1 hypothetical protein E4T99_06995 [Neisseria sp. WF04]